MIIDGITTPSGTVLDVSELDAIDSAVPKGTVLKVEQTYIDTTHIQAFTSGVKDDVTGFTLTITPTSVNSRFLIRANWNGEISAAHDAVFGLRRNGTDIGMPVSPGNRTAGMSSPTISYYSANDASTPESCHIEYLDSPATVSPITYTMTMELFTSSSLYTNRTFTDTDTGTYERLTSNITVMEIAG